MKSSDEAGNIAAAIASATTIHLASHENPDGDAIGSLLGMRLGLLALGKQVAVATPTPPPARFDFLPGFGAIGDALPASAAELAIALDCDGISRLGKLQAAFEAAAVVADVDHHRIESAFGDLRFVQPHYAATAMMVLDILYRMELTIDSEIATCLYTGLITDTGGFRFTNTDAEALCSGARLLVAGADPADLARRVFSLRRLGVRLLAGRALNSLRPVAGGQVLVASLSQTDFADTGTHPDDTDGLIDEFRDTTGVEVAVLFKEVEPDTWNVSLRSQGADVAEVAASFGGGGHRLASGCLISGERVQVERMVLDAIRALLGRDEAFTGA